MKSYQQHWGSILKDGFDEEAETLTQFFSFIQKYPNCFERSLRTGHITGSALILNDDSTQVLLTHHRKLNRWLQLGGHSDGNPKTFDVSFREAQEESGLAELHFYALSAAFQNPSSEPFIFDLDIHKIPAHKNEAEHLHYDVRYLLQTSRPDSICLSEESHDLRWFGFEAARKLCQERSMERQFEKLAFYLRKS